jgi:hypothetical protein
MTVKTRVQLAAQFDEIRNETGAGANTKARIANAYQDTLDSVISTVNGSPVTGIATDAHAVSVSAGTATILRPIPNVYGDRSVARRIVDSLTPAKKVTLIKWGDSRGSDQSTEQPLMTYGYGVPWGGRHTIMGPLDNGAPWTNVSYGPTTTPVSTAIDTYLGRWSPGGAYRSEMAAGASPSGSNERCWLTNWSFDSTIELAQAPQMVGHACKASMIVRKHAGGVVDDHNLDWWVRGAAYTKPYYAWLATYSASPVTARVDLDVPDTFCAANPVISIEVGGFGTQVAGQSLDVIDVLFESTIGVTLINLSVGSRTIDQFLSADVWSPNLWTECISLYSGEKIFWMSLGTNGVGLGPAESATFKAKTLTAIAEFRAAYPNGYVLLDTAYHTNLEPGWVAGRRRAYIDIANETTGVLCLDTMGEMGVYTDLLAAALYTAGDAVHFNALGRQHYARCVSDMIARAAT